MVKTINKHKNKNKLSIITKKKYQKISTKDENNWRTKIKKKPIKILKLKPSTMEVDEEQKPNLQ